MKKLLFGYIRFIIIYLAIFSKQNNNKIQKILFNVQKHKFNPDKFDLFKLKTEKYLLFFLLDHW